MKTLEPLKYIWKDRKRYFGLPISFTRYSLTDDRIFCETGLLNLKGEEILLYRVRDLSLRLSLGQRIFRVGSIILQSSDRSTPSLELRNIRQPREVKELIHQQVENAKLSRKMRLGEILEDPDFDNDDAAEGMGLID